MSRLISRGHREAALQKEEILVGDRRNALARARTVDRRRLAGLAPYSRASPYRADVIIDTAVTMPNIIHFIYINKAYVHTHDYSALLCFALLPTEIKKLISICTCGDYVTTRK